MAAQLQAAFAAGVNHGFLIRDANENQDHEQQFFSREKGENPPQLVVTYAPAPVVDTIAPQTSITGQPADPSAGATATFSFAGVDDTGGAVTFRCRLDGAAYVPARARTP